MKRDMFEGAIEEEMAHSLGKAAELDPGSQEYLNTMRSIKEMSSIIFENERLADEAEAKVEEAKTEKKKILADIGKFGISIFTYVGLTKFLADFNSDKGNIFQRDALRVLEFLRPKK